MQSGVLGRLHDKVGCYYPTTWIFLDDEERFLSSLEVTMNPKQPCCFFSNHTEALAYIERNCPNEMAFQSAPYTDVENVNDFISQPNRFKEPSVVVVDFAMPGKNGIEVCQELLDFPIRKLLLTGVADEGLANDAFNQGVIQGYIKKNDPFALEKIGSYAQSLSEHYLSQKFPVPKISAAPEVDLALVLESKEFKDFLESHSVVEYYFIKEPLGVLCISADGGLSQIALGPRPSTHFDTQMMPESLEIKVRNDEVLVGAIDKLPRTAVEADRYDWEENAVAAVQIAKTEIWIGFPDSPASPIDFVAAQHSLNAYLEE